MKISYSCVGSLRSKISSHNRRVLSDRVQVGDNCNCLSKMPALWQVDVIAPMLFMKQRYAVMLNERDKERFMLA